MTTYKNINKKLLNPKFRVLVLFCVVLYFLAILQDYIFSKIRFTGFYWSDTMLYNIYWLLLIPFIAFANYSYHKVEPKTIINKILYCCVTGLIFSASHIFIFTSIFILGSNIIYSVPHKFSTILKSAISNQSQITIIIYLFIPLIIEYFTKREEKKDTSFQKHITIKNGIRRIKVELSAITFIKADKPYTKIFSKNQELLHDESLKKLEKLLDPQTFIRVHRSHLINKNHIVELKSRKNGDYDGFLTNGQSVRFSRHYRQNWNILLNHLA